MISALFTITPNREIRATKLNLAVPFGAIEAIFLEINAPLLSVKSTGLINSKPAGNTSFTFTFVAESGPIFVTVIVKVTISPTFAFGLLTVFDKLKSAICEPIVTLSWSSSPFSVPLFGLESGSNWSDLLISALLVIVPDFVVFATIVKTLFVPDFMVSIFAVKIVPAKAKSLLLTKVKPSGK